ncbi:hypothetical protein Agub_g12002, partial [Astrephomene gubernaculifera]
MGNVLAQPVRVPVDPLADLPGVVLKDTLGGGRFLKTLLCLHDSGGLVVVKVYFKRPDTAASGLEPYKQHLAAVRAALSSGPSACQHAWPWQAWVESQHVGYLVRQHLAQNLYDRLSTRPFMSKLEKRWVAYQLLVGAAQVHGRGVVHGDIKSENVLLTSWGWACLADFASGLKPVALPADNPAEYSFFFDTGGRRRAYIAPERFYTPGSPGEARAAAALSPQMDIFSLGCVIAEVFCDGKALFDLSALLSYRRGDAAADPAANGALAAVDPDVRRLVLHMIQLDPNARWSAAQYLSDWSEPLFPPYFPALHSFFASLLPLDADARVAATAAAFPRLRREILAAAGSAATPGGAAAAAAGDKGVVIAVASAGTATLAQDATATATSSAAPRSSPPPVGPGASVPAQQAPAAAAAAAGGGGGPSAVLGGAGGSGAAAGLVSLLDEVGALLADSGAMARRFRTAADGVGGGGMLDSRSGSGSVGGSDAFLLDGDEEPDDSAAAAAAAAAGGRPGGSGAAAMAAVGGGGAAATGLSAGAAAAVGGEECGERSMGVSVGPAVIEEVVQEVVYEYQVREPWGAWQGASADDDEALVGGMSVISSSHRHPQHGGHSHHHHHHHA